jgi:hypothetical protein
MIRLLSINRLGTEKNLVGRITVFENKIKSKLKGLAFAKSGILKDCLPLHINWISQRTWKAKAYFLYE